MQLLDDLNDGQRLAASAGDGPVLIVAGPGTGKTKTLTTRAAFLLEQGVSASEIVALTFTKKAANEMRERLAKLLGAGRRLPNITTFHALGHDLLKQHGNGTTLLDEARRMEIIRSLAKPVALKRATPRELSLIISRAKTSLTSMADEPTTQLLQRYEAALTDQSLHDFDDLLIKAFALLKGSKGARYQHVLVDEFQDTSELQYEMLKLLSTHQNIFAIGDPNQSIYAFRGAGAEMFDRFKADFPEVTAVNLTINYRSRPEIITLANKIFLDAPQLTTHQHEPGKVAVIQTLNEYSEAAYVLETIEDGIGGSDFQTAHAGATPRQPRDYAVLYRTHRAAKVLQKAFAEHGIPYQIAGEGSPYERPEIQAIIALMRHLYTNGEVPTVKGFTQTQIKKLLADVSSDQTVHDLAAQLTVTFGFTIDQDLRQFLGMLVQFGSDVTAALQHVDDISEGEFYDPTVNAVTLMTIHASKGLEFEHIFLIGAEEGILPKLNAKGEGNIAEEQRLFYVAATRAKQNLEILHTKKRAGEQPSLSRFVEMLSSDILPRTVDPNMQALEKRLRKHQQKRAQTSLF